MGDGRWGMVVIEYFIKVKDSDEGKIYFTNNILKTSRRQAKN